MAIEYQKYKLQMVKEKSVISNYDYSFTCSDDVGAFLNGVARMNLLDRECVIALAIDCKGNLIGYNTVAIGELSQATIHPRELFKFAILSNASGIIMAHNHLSGCLEPSNEDIRTTKRIHQAGELMGIRLLDHVIVGNGKVHSIIKESLV